MATTRKSTKTSAKKTTKKPIEPRMAIFPGGIVFLDINRRERGDYKHLAMVRPNGVILWYIDEKTLPSKIKYWILKESRKQVREFEKRYDNFNKYRNNPNRQHDFIKDFEDNERYINERNEYLDQIAEREKAIRTYPAKRRR